MIEAENKHNPALLDEFLAPDFVNEIIIIPDPPTETPGREIYKQGSKTFIEAFPDFHGTIEDIIAEGDKVWIRYKGTGTHKGEYLGLTPTGKKITMTAFGIYRITDTKVVKLTNFIDRYFFKDLGIIE